MSKHLNISILVILLAFTYFTYSTKYKDKLYAELKCPDEYESSEEYLASTNKFTNAFFDKNPDASLTDWANERKRFYDIKGCSKAIQRYESYSQFD